jgi:nucleoside-specific outer membrane channel protein Tsx
VSVSCNAAIWNETSVSYLRGNNYELANRSRTILTFEHASGWEYGDNYMFLDVIDPFVQANENITELYGEWSPRFSMGKIFGFYEKDRFVQDFLISSTLEYGRSGVISRAGLYGIGIDLNIPYFSYFNYNFYIRDDFDVEGVSTQSTIVWLVPFEIKKLKFQFRGFADIVHSDEGSGSSKVESYVHTSPQLLLDLGALFNAENKLYGGVEFDYWSKKFGIPGGPEEKNPQFMFKWIF